MRIAILFLLAVALTSAADRALERALPLYSRTDYEGAAAILRHAQLDPQNLQLLGQCYFMEGDYKHATEVLEKAAALDPHSSMIFTWLARAYGRRAESSFPIQALGYAQKTREYFEKAVQLDPKNGEAVNDLFEFYLQAPSIVGGGIDKARNLVPVIAKIDPVEVHFAKARLAEDRKQFDEAESQYRKAWEMAPQQIGRLLDVAKFLARRGRFAEADRLFDQADKAAPDSPRVIFARAQVYVKAQRRVEEAQVLLKRYLALSNLTPDDPSKGEAQRLQKKLEGGGSSR